MTKANILIVEDERLIAIDIQQSLESQDFVCCGITARGAEAIRLAGELRPDLVLMDIGLKGEMDGIEAAAQIRAQFDIPIIFLTAFSTQSTLERASLAEPFSYLLKPFNARELDSNISIALYKHKMEKKLRESEARLRIVAENAPSITIQVNRKAEIEYISRVLPGFSMESTLGQNIENWLEPEYRSEMRAKLELVFTDGQPQEYESRGAGAYGDLRWYLTRLSPVELNGKVTSVVLSAMDITERKQAEMEIQEARNQLKATLEAIPDLVFELDLDGRYLSYHSNNRDLLALPPEDFLGKTVAEVLTGEAAQIVQAALEEANDQGFSLGKQIVLDVPQGKRWFELSVARKFGAQGEAPRFILLSRNITQRKQLEQAEREQRLLTDAMNDLISSLTRTLKVDEVLERTLDNINRIADADAVVFVLFEQGALRSLRFRSLNPRLNIAVMKQEDLVPSNAHLIRWVIEHHQTLLISDTLASADWREIEGMQWVRSFICVPVEIRGEVVGVINLANSSAGALDQPQAERLTVFARHAAVAIENALLYEETHHLSLTDPLTGLNNRRFFFEAANGEFERLRRYPGVISLMMVDLDHFKKINDSFGHTIGDLALTEIAQRIKTCVRSIDVVARYGGEEFVILMPETGLKEALQAAERVRQAVSKTPIARGGVEFSVTTSIGVAETDETTTTLDALLFSADQGLYAAKAGGRNRVEAARQID